MRAGGNGKPRKVKTASLRSTSKSSEIFLKVYGSLITDPVRRTQAVSFIKAVDSKKIRNTSGV